MAKFQSMAESNETITRVRIDAGQAVQEAGKVVAAHKEMGQAAQQAGKGAAEGGQAAQKAGQQAREGGGGFREMGRSVKDVATSFLGFTSAAGGIIFAIRAIGQAASDSLRAVTSLGNSLRDLANNVGGKRAGELKDSANQLALQYHLGSTGRNNLIAATTSISDLVAPRQLSQLQASLGRLMGVERNLNPNDTAEMLAALTAQGMSTDQAADTAGTLLSSHFDPKEISTILQKSGQGGMDLLPLLLASRKTGLVGNTRGQATSLLARLMAPGELPGLPSKQLMMLGVKANMSASQRLEYLLGNAPQLGRIKIESAIGAENMGAFEAMLRAQQVGLVPQAQRELANGGSLAEMEAQQAANPSIVLANSAADDELTRQLKKENGAVAGAGLLISRANTWAAGQPGGLGNPALGWAQAASAAIAPGLPVAGEVRSLGRNVINYIGTQYNQASPYQEVKPASNRVGE